MTSFRKSAFFKRIDEKAKENLRTKLLYGLDLVTRIGNNDKVPFPAQIIRVYEAVANGTKRMVLADTTGFGKTYVATMILGFLNEKIGRRQKVLLIAPKQSLESAWTEEQINSDINGLGLGSGRPLKVSQLERRSLDDAFKSNIVCLNYHKFNCATSDTYVKAILDMAKKFDLIILDESQNHSSFKKRGNNIEKIIQVTKNKRVLMLSATPGQNGLEDLGMPLHVLNPDCFPFEPYDYNSNPQAINQMIIEGKWFNSDRETVKQLFNLPELKEYPPYYCDLGDHYARRYLDVWKNGDLFVGSKVSQLRKYLLLGKLKSKEGRRDLENLLESFPRNEAILTFTHLKTGISGELFNFLERFYGKGNVAKVINGDMKSVKERVEITRRFGEGEYKALSVSLLTMGEGVPCTTGDRAVHLLFLEMPYNHGRLNQAIGRPYRPGQIGKVHLHYILGHSDWLKEEMIKIVQSGELQRKYSIYFSTHWRESLIDEDILNIMKEKDRIDKEKVRKGIKLDDVEEVIMMYNEENKESFRLAEKTGVLQSLGKKMRNNKIENSMKNNEKESPMSLFARTGSVLYGVGEKELYKASIGKGEFSNESEYMLQAYSDERVFNSSAADTARLIKRVVDKLESKGERFRELLDLGCGNGLVSRVLDRRMVNLDLDKRMLEMCKKYGIGPCKYGYMTHLDFRNNRFDLVTASYSLFYLRQDGGKREMEKTFIEANRVLKDDSYFIASLIRTTKHDDVKTIAGMMGWYGFKVLINDFFRGYREDGTRSNFRGAYLLVGKKDFDQKKFNNVEGGFSTYVRPKYFVSRGRSIQILEDDSIVSSFGRRKMFREVHSEYFVNRRGASLDKIIDEIEV